jgi:hypothetical protein
METPAAVQLEYTLDSGVGEIAAVSRRTVQYTHKNINGRNMLCIRVYVKYNYSAVWINRKPGNN